MLIERSTPPSIAPPIGRYSHLARVSGPAEWVFISGQVGQDTEGRLAPDVYSQTLLVFENIKALLASVGAGPESIVRLLTFLVGPDETCMAEFARARNEVYAEWFPEGDVPGHSLSMAPALARPDVLVEVEGWAAIAPGSRAS